MRSSWFSFVAVLALATSVFATDDSDLQEIYDLGFAGVERDFDPTAGFSLDEALEPRNVVGSESEAKSNEVVARALASHQKGAHRMEKRGKTGSFSTTITWYTGHDLLYPSCAQQSHWNPTDKSLVTALTIGWPGYKPKCGSFLKLVAPNGHYVTVRVWDSCAGCSGKWTDLTQRGFKALYSLDVGKKSGIRVVPVGKPFKKWTKQIEQIYGPQHQ